jgi:hypothetical protein
VLNFFWEHLRLPCESAALVLGHIGDPRAVPALTAALSRHNRDLRTWSAEALGLIGPPAREAVPALLRMAGRRHDWDDMAQAIRALRRIGDSSDEVINTLIKVHRRNGRRTQWSRPQAVLALGVLAGEQPQVRERLERSVKGHVEGEVLAAHAALARLGEPMEGFLDEWDRQSEADRRLVDGLTVDLLETIAPVARASLPEICELIQRHQLTFWSSPEEVFPALLAIDPASPDLHRLIESHRTSDYPPELTAARRALLRAG